MIDVADLVACRQIAAVRREGAGVEHRRKVVRRHFAMTAQLVDHLAARGVPNPADHIVGDTCDDLAVGVADLTPRIHLRCASTARNFDPDSMFHQMSLPS